MKEEQKRNQRLVSKNGGGGCGRNGSEGRGTNEGRRVSGQTEARRQRLRGLRVARGHDLDVAAGAAVTDALALLQAHKACSKGLQPDPPRRGGSIESVA